MNTKSILSILNEINENNGKIYKAEKLEEYSNNELLQKVIYYTYNPNFNYYIVKTLSAIPALTASKNLWDVISLLDEIMEKGIRGNTALEMVRDLMNQLCADDIQVFKKILDGDLKVGCSTTSFNKANKGLIPTTHYMGCQGSNIKKIKHIIARDGGIYDELKSDGMYVNVIMNGSIELVSRQGKPVNVNGKIFSELSRLNEISPKSVLNGELMLRGFSRGVANGYLARIKTVNDKIDGGAKDATSKLKKLEKDCGMTFDELQDCIYIEAWDIIPYDAYILGRYDVCRQKRIEVLNDVLDSLKSSFIIPQYAHWCKTFEEVTERLKNRLADGWEGSILKSKNCPWVDGKTQEQFKFKVEFTVEMKIVSCNYGNKGTKYEELINAFTVQSECGKMQCNCDSLKDDIKNLITENPDKYVGTIITMKCNGLSINKDGEYNFYYPKFVELRDDKTTANTQEEIIQIEQDVLNTKQITK